MSNTNEEAKKRTKLEPLGASTEMGLEKILSLCYAVPMGNPNSPDCIWGAVPSLEGQPGIGKSARVRASAEMVNLQVGVVELGGRAPEDASGAPFLTKDDKLVIACLLGAVNDLSAIGKGVLFLDEINWARPTTQGAFLSAVQERRVGDTKFSNYTRIVLASNPPKSAGGGNPLIPPMANRCLHFSVNPPTDIEENAYLMNSERRKVEVEDIQLRVQNAWHDEWPKQVGAMIGFKKKYPDYVLAEPSPGDPKHHKAWPSPRSRETALRAVTTIRILESTIDDKGKLIVSPFEDLFVEAACGKKMAIDWAMYREESKIPDPVDMLNGKWKPAHGKIDLTMAAYAACTTHVISRPKKEERVKLAPVLWNLFMPLFNLGLADIALSSALALTREGLNMNTNPEMKAAAKPVYLEFAERKMDKFLEDK